MELLITRTLLHPSNTMGKFFIDGTFYANTLEDTYRELGPNGEGKIQGQTCIPNGRYKVVVDWSNHFGHDMPHILDVPFYDGIRIHSGNTDADTEGCPLIGAQTNGLNRIWDCKGLVDSLIEKIQATYASGGECWITIEVAPATT